MKNKITKSTPQPKTTTKFTKFNSPDGYWDVDFPSTEKIKRYKKN